MQRERYISFSNGKRAPKLLRFLHVSPRLLVFSSSASSAADEEEEAERMEEKCQFRGNVPSFQRRWKSPRLLIFLRVLWFLASCCS
jgi:hypothetical protein